MRFGFTAVYWITYVLHWLLLLVQVVAFVDCATRKSDAFPAADKLTKPGWLLITALAIVVTYLFPPWSGILGLVGVIGTIVYFVDVRPAVRQPGSRW